MRELHCKSCGRFLLKVAFGEFEIKCPKCKANNKVRIISARHLLGLTQEEETAILKA